MNKIRICGNLTKAQEGFFKLDVERKSGTIDSLLVKDDGTLKEGLFLITGHIHAEYIYKIGVPVMIIPESVEPAQEGMQISKAVLSGAVKKKPVLRHTKQGVSVATVMLVTEEGHIPVILWNTAAERAVSEFVPGMMVKVKGRLQSREHPDKKCGIKTTYELSAGEVSVL